MIQKAQDNLLKLSVLAMSLAPMKVFAADDKVRINTGSVESGGLGFGIPSFSLLLTFLVRFFFVIAGLSALLFLLWGAFDWVISGGESDKVKKAREKIMQALVGVVLIVATLSIMSVLEQVVFKGALCFGVSCDLTIPSLLEKSGP